MISHCVDCKFFSRWRRVVPGPPGSGEERIEVDDIGGDCRRHPPQVTFWGTKWPYVTTGDSCGEFKHKATF
jgi:hypothetical protein